VRRVLVTGASGLIGRRALGPLRDRGFEVHGVTSKESHESDPDVVWHRADLLDPSALDPLLDAAKPTDLLHLAWYAAPGSFWTSLENVDWVAATLRLLMAFAAAGGRRATLAGSCAEYRWGDDVLSERTTPLEPSTLYGACKLATYTAGRALADQLDLSLAWGRIFFLYGPGEHPDRLVASVTRGLLAGEPTATTEGLQVRDFMHVDDVAGALVALLAADVDGPVNIGSGARRTVREIVTAVGRATDRLELIEFGALASREGDPPSIVADTRRLSEEVAYVPRIGLEEGIAQTVAWWRQHG
jgi:nucleoside-diphosphate-sugar epimerase